MFSAGTQLDRLLYDWLAETDDRKFDKAFERYYAAASTQLIRYLTRRSSLADLDCEQIAVDALLKFFGRVGRERRQAAAVVREALPRIKPLDLGPYHVRQVRRWTDEVGTFRYRSMTFALQQCRDDRPWKSEIQAINDTMSPLQRQGCQLLEAARSALSSTAGVESGAAEAASGDGAEDGGDPWGNEWGDGVPGYAVIRRFAARMRAAIQTAGSGELGDADSFHPGFRTFVDGSWSVVDSLPKMRVPTNGYLFDMAQSLYLDECKARGRKKRGGSGFDPSGAKARGGLDVAGLPALPSGDDSVWGEEEVGERGPWRGADAMAFEGLAAASSEDPALSQTDEDFCEQFFAYLRKPVAEAEEALREASTAGRADAARKRLDSISRKNDRLLSVLTLRIEGHTQEAIAEKLDISRNQVKYIVELVQSAYQQWGAQAARSARS